MHRQRPMVPSQASTCCTATSPFCGPSQSFGRVGTPGALVWLGYSWKDGPQAAWGALLKKLVVDFRNGGWLLLRDGSECLTP